MKVKVNCKECNKEFESDSRELNRGYGTFCSSSCAGIYGNKNKKTYTKECIECKNIFNTKTPSTAKYCSNPCKLKSYRKSQKSEVINTTALQKLIGYLPCEICGWKETTRDIHHILPVSKGGKNTIDNLIVVCPNHHRMFHKNLISQEAVQTALKSRLYHHPELYQELDA